MKTIQEAQSNPPGIGLILLVYSYSVKNQINIRIIWSWYIGLLSQAGDIYYLTHQEIAQMVSSANRHNVGELYLHVMWVFSIPNPFTAQIDLFQIDNHNQ